MGDKHDQEVDNGQELRPWESMRESVAGNVNTEAEESLMLGAVTKLRLMNTVEWEDLVRIVVNCKVRNL